MGGHAPGWGDARARTHLPEPPPPSPPGARGLSLRLGADDVGRQVRAEVVGGMTVVSGNVNADLGADFAIQLTGGHALNAGNFVL